MLWGVQFSESGGSLSRALLFCSDTPSSQFSPYESVCDIPAPPLSSIGTAGGSRTRTSQLCGLLSLLDAEGWQPVAEPAWTDTPDWDAIDRHAKQLRRQY
jgi:hypothetical protein